MCYTMASQRSARHIDRTTMFLSELDYWVVVIPPQTELCTQQIIEHIGRPISHFVIHPSQPYRERRNPYMLQESFFQQPTDPTHILFHIHHPSNPIFIQVPILPSYTIIIHPTQQFQNAIAMPSRDIIPPPIFLPPSLSFPSPSSHLLPPYPNQLLFFLASFLAFIYPRQFYPPSLPFIQSKKALTHCSLHSLYAWKKSLHISRSPPFRFKHRMLLLAASWHGSKYSL